MEILINKYNLENTGSDVRVFGPGSVTFLGRGTKTTKHIFLLKMVKNKRQLFFTIKQIDKYLGIRMKHRGHLVPSLLSSINFKMASGLDCTCVYIFINGRLAIVKDFMSVTKERIG